MLTKEKKENSVGRDILAYVPVKIVPGLAGLLSVFLLARNLVPSDYARYSIIITAAMLAVQLCSTWLASAIQYHLPGTKEDERKGFVCEALGLQAMLSIVSALFAAIVVLLTTGSYSLAVLGFFLVFFQALNFLTQAIFQSLRKIKEQLAVVSLQGFSWVIILASVLWLLPATATGGAIAIVTSNALGASVALCFVIKMLGGCHPRDFVSSLPNFKKITQYGLPMCCWFFATQVFSLGDRLIFPLFGITEGIGQYMTFRDIAVGLTGFLTMPILMAVHPAVMRLWRHGDGREQVQTVLTESVESVLLMTFPVLICAGLLGSEVMVLAFGSEYSSSGVILTLVYVSIIALVLSVYFQKGLEVTGKTIQLASLAFIVACIFTVGSLVVIPKLGVLGGALLVCSCSLLYLILVAKASAPIVRPQLKARFCIKLLVWGCVTVALDWFQTTAILDIFGYYEVTLWQRLVVLLLMTMALIFIDGRFRALLENVK